MRRRVVEQSRLGMIAWGLLSVAAREGDLAATSQRYFRMCMAFTYRNCKCESSVLLFERVSSVQSENV